MAANVTLLPNQANTLVQHSFPPAPGRNTIKAEPHNPHKQVLSDTERGR
ncbi:MAG: hypothetical protein K940chlam7_00957 [Chlamydiae bacterium]|nr:hypothetical protein [Chlamydiota bacterium]